MTVQLFDKATIDRYVWPDTPDGRTGRAYLYPMIKEGVAPYLTNVTTQLQLVVYQDIFLPITINEKEYENSYIASNYYAIKFYEENLSKKSPFLLKMQKPFLTVGSSFLKLFQVNKTIFLNNWLMTNSLAPPIAPNALKVIVEFLTQKFPTHTLIFRHVDLQLKRDLYNTLNVNNFHLLKTREIYFYNPEDKATHSATLRKICRRDLRLLEKFNFEVVEDIHAEDYPRMLELYERIYVQKYSSYSPQYTLKFIQETHENKMVKYVLLKRGGVIEGFFSYFIFNNMMINCLFGYDTDSPCAHETYKLITRLVYEEADKLKLTINDGSGGDKAKSQRGLKTSPEFMGVYSAHLPLPRRLLWNTIAFFYKKLAA